jgi:Sec-independent protein translocase protein TatA
MPNISFSEILFILILAFILLGPEELLKTAKTLGLALKKIKQQYLKLQDELNSPDKPNKPQ